MLRQRRLTPPALPQRRSHLLHPCYPFIYTYNSIDLGTRLAMLFFVNLVQQVILDAIKQGCDENPRILITQAVGFAEDKVNLITDFKHRGKTHKMLFGLSVSPARVEHQIFNK